ncbi:MAG: hypothetical protein ACXWIU_06265 [Limisphaerales bacterium]
MRKIVLGRFLLVSLVLAPFFLHAQIDPDKRTLFQLGYNQPLVGKSPVAAYAFYYRNQPDFLSHSNLTLRLAIAPVYADSELGIRGAFGENTDVGIGVAGGGFADSYYEINGGQYLKGESFTGHGGLVSASVYHLFNPGQRVPLSGILHVTPHYIVYDRDSDTAPTFVLPHDHLALSTRAGLRLGGREPVMIPDVALELSVWYENQYRTGSGAYGFNGDRELKELSHLFWARALFIYTTKAHHNFSVSVSAGGSMEVDRFSAYRLGGDLPLSSEFPLIIPGYYYQELSARKFVCFTGEYSLPLDHEQRWSLKALGSAAGVDFIPGEEPSRHFNSGLGAGIGYRSKSGFWQIIGSYGYGFQALRNNGPGGQSIGLLCQIDFEARHRAQASAPLLDPTSPQNSRGLFRFLQNVF